MTTFLNYKNFILLFIVAIAVLTSSCSGSKKARAALAKTVAAAKDAQQGDAAMLEAMRIKKEEKVAEEKIDSAANIAIGERINSYKKKLDSAGNAVSFIDSAIKSGKLFRKNKAAIKLNLQLVNNYTNDGRLRLMRFAMIDEGLNIAQQYLFNLGAYFGGGKYEIPAEKMKQAQQSFSPILDSISNFYNRYSEIGRFATITILGFADGTGFNKEGQTYKTLIGILKDSLATKEMINQKVSQLRAKNMADIMEVILSKKIPDYANIHALDFAFLEIGKGEEYPSKKITDYTVNDERRRVVLLFWNILPK